MAQKFNYQVTAKKIVTPDQKVFNYPSGLNITVADEAAIIIPVNGTSDSLILTVNGFQITAQIAAGTLATNISATDSTGS